MPARHNEERVSMVQFEIEDQNRNRWNPSFNWKKNLKIFGYVFLIISVCGVVAYASTALICFLFEHQLVSPEASNKTTVNPKSETTTFGDNFINIGSYLLISLLFGFVVSAAATYCWHFLKERLGNQTNTTTTTPKTTTRSTPILRTTRVPATIPRSTVEPLLRTSPQPTPHLTAPGPFRIVGFYDAWSKYEIRESQLRKLTHIIFSALDMNSKGTLSFHDYGIRKKFIDLVEMARRVNPKLKIMFSIGEYAYSSNFESVAVDPEKRRTLSDSIATMLETHKIDGVDLFWKWPDKVENREPFVLLLQEIRKKLTSLSEQYILSVVMPSFDWPVFKKTLDLNGIMENVDFMNVRSMNYYGYWHSSWGAYTGPPSPLYSGLGAYEDSNVNWTITHYSSETGLPMKLNMGVPFFGAQWKNVEGAIDVKEEMWFTAKMNDEKTFEGGYIPWREIENEDLSRSKWHQESRTSFIWIPNEQRFLGIENSRSLKEKMKYAIDINLGGITIWSVEMDDDSDILLNSVQIANKKL